jgi:sulfonate transport system substrate-binding protein
MNPQFLNYRQIVLRALTAATVTALAGTASAQNFGKPGEPVELVVGHPCCYTEVWSVMALRGRELWKKYLPPGSSIKYEVGLQGSTIVNSMLARKQHIGYIGDLPAIIATTKESVADIRIVAVAAVAYDQCNILLTRKDAPEFKSGDEAGKWLIGKQVAVPKGTCSDIFSREVFKRAGGEPAAYLNQNVEVITSGFRAGKLDGAAIWEAIAARLVLDGLARRVASGIDYGLKDSSYIVMSADLIKQRPDVVKAWLNAELDAQKYLSDPGNAAEMTKMVMTQTTGFSEKAIWKALYGMYPKSQGGTDPRMELPFTFTPEVMALLKKDTEFLYSISGITSSSMRPEAIMTEFADGVLAERNLKPPIGQVPALPDSAYHGN